ncbi:hypothetical protein B0T22DRAFT_457368 [Podospora appendiculata]|uniref:Uncharacterized protein n=1 Tax=Podospora appendiculata TaxID=314037 RepID=A0AAE0X7X5_9PEZI|nr:hypothetical protein B0T22DRAFT_457368 [Podospora appendiculata]
MFPSSSSWRQTAARVWTFFLLSSSTAASVAGKWLWCLRRRSSCTSRGRVVSCRKLLHLAWRTAGLHLSKIRQPADRTDTGYRTTYS